MDKEKDGTVWHVATSRIPKPSRNSAIRRAATFCLRPLPSKFNESTSHCSIIASLAKRHRALTMTDARNDTPTRWHVVNENAEHDTSFYLVLPGRSDAVLFLFRGLSFPLFFSPPSRAVFPFRCKIDIRVDSPWFVANRVTFLLQLGCGRVFVGPRLISLALSIRPCRNRKPDFTKRYDSWRVITFKREATGWSIGKLIELATHRQLFKWRCQFPRAWNEIVIEIHREH